MAPSRRERRRSREASPRPDHARRDRSTGGITTRERDLTEPNHTRSPPADRRGSDRDARRSTRSSPVEPVHPTSDSPWTRMRSRRDVLKLGAAIAAGGVVAPLLAACAAPSGQRSGLGRLRVSAARHPPRLSARPCPVPSRSWSAAAIRAPSRRCSRSTTTSRPSTRPSSGTSGRSRAWARNGIGSRAPRWSPASRSGS